MTETNLFYARKLKAETDIRSEMNDASKARIILKLAHTDSQVNRTESDCMGIKLLNKVKFRLQ